MPNIVYYNIALRETVGRELRRTRAQAEAYTSATGYSKVTPYVGRWEEVVALMDEICSAPADAYAVTCEATGIEAGLAELRVTEEEYERPSSDEGGEQEDEIGTEGQPAYSGSTSASMEPLLAHPMFSGLSESEMRALKAVMDGRDECELISDDAASTGAKRIKDLITSAAGRKALGFLRKGITHYYCPHSEANARWRGASNSYTACSIISQPPGSVVKTPPGYNWLVTSVGTDKQGDEVWQSASFQLSAAGGWNTELYATTGIG